MEIENKTILAIDDTSAIRVFLEISLETKGANFYGAETGAQGLQLLKEKEPDMVILDLGLPDIDGLKLLPKIKQESSAPVIVLTARREGETRIESLENGAENYLTKPFFMSSLLEVIKAV